MSEQAPTKERVFLPPVDRNQRYTIDEATAYLAPIARKDVFRHQGWRNSRDQRRCANLRSRLGNNSKEHAMNLRSLPVVIRQQVATADLPVNYEAAKAALAACVQLDECKEWANRMAAIASYARQSKDDSLESMASRIRLRALRRVGELLSELSSSSRGPRQGIRSDRRCAVDANNITAGEAARLVRIAGIPKQDFESRVEATPTPSLRQLDPGWSAVLVKQVSGATSEINSYTQLQQALAPLVQMIVDERTPAKEVARRIVRLGLPAEYLEGLRHAAIDVGEWLDEFEQALPKAQP